MEAIPKWYKPVAIIALIWNLFGCFAYLADVRMSPEDLAKLTEAQQSLYAARPSWAVAATAFGVWCGALGCVGLILRKRWANILLLISLAGVIAQDVWLFGLSGGASQAGAVAFVLQGVVLAISIGLVLLGRKAQRNGWLN